MLGQLDGDRADAAGAGMDQHLLPRLQLGAFDQHLPGGQGHEGQGGGFFHADVLRLQREVGLVHRDELREGPDPVLAGPRIHLVAGLEALHLGPDADHDPRQVVAQHQRKTIGQDELELAVADLGVQRIQAGRVDGDQHVALAQLRLRHLAQAQGAALRIAVEKEGFHGCFPAWSRRRSLRMPASTMPAGAKRRSRRSRFASLPAG